MSTQKRPSPLPMRETGLLGKISARSVVSDEVLEGYIKRGQAQRLVAGTELFTQGVRLRELYVVSRGRLMLLRDGIPLYAVCEGEMVGEEDILFDEPSRYTARADGDCVVTAVPEGRFKTMMQNLDVAVTILKKNLLWVRRMADALATRTTRVAELDAELEEKARIHKQDVEFLNSELKKLRGEVATKKTRIAALEAQQREAEASAEKDNELIEKLQESLLKDVKVFGPPVESRPEVADEAEIEVVVEVDIEPSVPVVVPEQTPIARVALVQVAVPRRRRPTVGYANYVPPQKPEPTPAVSNDELDALLADLRAIAPDDKAPKG